MGSINNNRHRFRTRVGFLVRTGSTLNLLKPERLPAPKCSSIPCLDRAVISWHVKAQFSVFFTAVYHRRSLRYGGFILCALHSVHDLRFNVLLSGTRCHATQCLTGYHRGYINDKTQGEKNHARSTRFKVSIFACISSGSSRVGSARSPNCTNHGAESAGPNGYALAVRASNFFAWRVCVGHQPIWAP